MIKKVAVLLVFVALFATNSFASCSSPGLQTGLIQSGAVGTTVSGNGQGPTSCTVFINVLYLTLTNVSSATGATVTMNVYANGTCTGSPSYSTTAGATSSHGSMGNGTITLTTPFALATNGAYCFSATGTAGFIVTAGISGYLD